MPFLSLRFHFQAKTNKQHSSQQETEKTFQQVVRVTAYGLHNCVSTLDLSYAQRCTGTHASHVPSEKRL